MVATLAFSTAYRDNWNMELGNGLWTVQEAEVDALFHCTLVFRRHSVLLIHYLRVLDECTLRKNLVMVWRRYRVSCHELGSHGLHSGEKTKADNPSSRSHTEVKIYMTEALTIFAVVGAIIAVGFLSNALFKKTGFPDTLFLMLIGIILGPLLGVFLREEMLPFTPFLTTLTLMMILFEGGLNMEIYKVLSQSIRATILGVLYVLAAMAFVALFGYFVLGLGWLEALLLGPMTAGTSSVVIIPLVSKLSINEEVGVTLSLESTITDVLNIVLVITFLQMYISGLVSVAEVASTIVTRFAVGALLGFLVGLVWIKVLGITKKQEFTYMLTIAALILCYVASEILGGSGSLSALLFGLVLGNYSEIYSVFSKKTGLGYMTESKSNLRRIQGELSFLIRAFFFCLSRVDLSAAIARGLVCRGNCSDQSSVPIRSSNGINLQE